MKRLLLLLLIPATGCADRLFTNVGNNTGVQVSVIRKYAHEHGISYDEASSHFAEELVADAP